MYLSRLLIDVGENPDRPRPGRLWLRNLYRVHQRLCMAFPSTSRKAGDTQFLRPYDPEDFAAGQVHTSRRENSGFLFRIDPRSGGRAVILVQSAIRPDWDYAFHNAPDLLAAFPECKEFDPGFAEDLILRFTLLANPTKKMWAPDGKTRNSRRIPVPCAEEIENWKRKHPGSNVQDFITSRLCEWLAGKSPAGGFSIDDTSLTVQPGYVYFKKPPKKNGKSDARAKRGNEDACRLRSVRYDGVLTVTDPDVFRETLIRGIGPAKAFGFGLLSVAPV